MKERKHLMREIQELSFALVEINLFLDNYPTNTQALADYRRIRRNLESARQVYENAYGPLLNFGYGENHNTNVWQWVEEPWPWEI